VSEQQHLKDVTVSQPSLFALVKPKHSRIT